MLRAPRLRNDEKGMCGIAGMLWAEPAAQRQSTAALLRLLQHRGPDDHGWLLLSGDKVRRGRGDPGDEPAQVVLVHRRLSILDLSAAGWQPMSSADGRLHLVFNGEIYNYLELRRELEQLGHIFHSRSDTEVLLQALAAWGRGALTRLVGMFAFALVDTRRRTLLLARDFFGIKPLYYAWPAGGFAFASEIKALLDLPGIKRQANPHRLYEYLRFGLTDHGGHTLFAPIRQLPAAHYLEVPLDRAAQPEPIRYWQVDPAERLDLSLEEAGRRLRELFLDSVRLHLRSDLPVGAALSGGIDSSAIVAAMRYLEPRLDLHAFSYVADDAAVSEERWIDTAGQAARAVVHKVQPRPEELVEDLDRLVHQQDEPFGSTSIYAQDRVFRLARQAGITVMLDGQGADEMLAGYRPYLAARLASLLRQGRLRRAHSFWKRAARLPGSGGRKHLLLHAASLAVPPGLKRWGLHLTGRTRMPIWLNSSWFADRGVKALPRRAPVRAADMLRQALWQSVAETSLPMLLRYEDRNSMAYSIESRVPFLTPALVSFVLRLPEDHLIGRDGTSKNVFRLAMRGLVPDSVLDRRDKIGFATPEQRWLGTLGPWVERALKSDAARQVAALNIAAMTCEWQAVREGKKPFDSRLWRWVNLIRWAERFDVNFGNA
jgi:asparagine synthase (glutamine-hydrolysing)